jgi:magnesium chelatase accessory protein
MAAATLPAAGRVSAPSWVERPVDAGGLRWWVTQQERPRSDTPPSTTRPILLLHGTGASAHSWSGLAPLLAAHGQVLALDLPGHGHSGPLPPGQPALTGMASALAELLHTLQVSPAVVIGHSAGAALMLRLALDGRLAGARLIGLNAALQPLQGVAGWLFPPLARLLARQPLVPRLAAWGARDERTVRRLLTSTGSLLDDAGVAHYAGLLRDPRHVAGVLAMTAQWDLGDLQRDLLVPQQQRLVRPLHLLVGEADRTVPPAQADRLALRMPGVSVHRLPGLGHLAHEEAPQAVAAALLPLLDPQGGAPPRSAGPLPG